MNRAEGLLQAILDTWEGEACPYCGGSAEPWIERVGETTLLRCGACDQEVEAFKLYVDEDGEPYTVNHERTVPDDGVVGRPYRVHVDGL